MLRLELFIFFLCLLEKTVRYCQRQGKGVLDLQPRCQMSDRCCPNMMALFPADDQLPQFDMLPPHIQGRRKLDHTHTKSLTSLFGKVHTFSLNPIKAFHGSVKMSLVQHRGLRHSKERIEFRLKFMYGAEGGEGGAVSFRQRRNGAAKAACWRAGNQEAWFANRVQEINIVNNRSMVPWAVLDGTHHGLAYINTQSSPRPING